MKAKYIVFSISYIVFAFFTAYYIQHAAYALAASPSPSPSPAPNKSLTEFQQKVEALKKEAASKAAELKNQVSKTIQNKAYIGQVLEAREKQITLQSVKGTRTINIDEYTLYQDTAKKGFSLKDIKKDDFLVALGDVDDKENLKAKKVIRTKQPSATEKYAVWGQVQAVVLGTITLVKQDDQKVSIKTDDKTLFGRGSDEASLSDLKTGNYVISVGSKLNNNTSISEFIYLLNPKGGLKRSATASAAPSASPKESF